jgi:hypothetical protein
VQALLIRFTTNLTQLARDAPRAAAAKTVRQYLARWLADPQWEPDVVYAGLTQELTRVLGRRRRVALLVDFTFLADRWMVLQVSVGWERRALPVYRAVCRWHDPEATQASMLAAACAWLRAHLPGAASRYVLIMDRGFPSHTLIRTLQAADWRFVLRVSGRWKLRQPAGRVALATLLAPDRLAGQPPLWYPAAELGRRGKGANEWSVAHVVGYYGPSQQEPWYLVTSERRDAVGLYRQRMQIEAEFRDLKGPWGLDLLGRWHDRDRVARFLAWVAVYEWRLVQLWVAHQLATCTAFYRAYGALSWITITRQWVQGQLQQHGCQALAWL